MFYIRSLIIKNCENDQISADFTHSSSFQSRSVSCLSQSERGCKECLSCFHRVSPKQHLAQGPLNPSHEVWKSPYQLSEKALHQWNLKFNKLPHNYLFSVPCFTVCIHTCSSNSPHLCPHKHTPVAPELTISVLLRTNIDLRRFFVQQTRWWHIKCFPLCAQKWCRYAQKSQSNVSTFVSF